MMLLAAAMFVQPQPDRVEAAIAQDSVPVAVEPVDHPSMSPSLQRPEMSVEHRKAATTVMTGTIVMSDSELVLRLPSGNEYRLEEMSDTERTLAASYAGKPVNVTGRVEDSGRLGKLIHVQTVQKLDAVRG
jgi:hypothetical protein